MQLCGAIVIVLGVVIFILGTWQPKPRNSYKVVVFDEKGAIVLTADLPFPNQELHEVNPPKP